jgi:NAD(P)H dehydrogenase (quinone)
MRSDKLILVTGAAGKTGLAVIRALAQRKVSVRAFVRHADQAQMVRAAGAAEIVIGDLLDPTIVSSAMQGISAVYLLFPNVHPQETQLARLALKAAKDNGVQSIVYHSVLFPQVEAMPHHWQKLRVEEALIQSGNPFTILQPSSYMQNINSQWEAIKLSGQFRVPYSIQSSFSLIDLHDLADAAVACLLETTHVNAIYPLAGPQNLTAVQMAAAMSETLGREVHASQQSLAECTKQAKNAGLSVYAIDALNQMFAFYDRNGFSGSPHILEWLIGRPPLTFSQYLNALVK